MMNWLRPLLMMFYAPARGMSEVRDRSPLAPAMLLAFLAQMGYGFCLFWRPIISKFGSYGPSIIFFILSQSVVALLLIAVLFVPTLALLANLFERRGSFSLVIQQEFAPLASTIFYAWTATNLIAIPLALLARASGVERGFYSYLSAAAQQGNVSLEMRHLIDTPLVQSLTFAVLLLMPLFAFWTVFAVRAVFRLSAVRSTLVMLISGI